MCCKASEAKTPMLCFTSQNSFVWVDPLVISKHTVSAEVISISKLFLCTCSIKIGVCWSFPWGPPLYNFSWSRTLSIHPTFCIFSMSKLTIVETSSHVTLNSTSSFCLHVLKSFFWGQCLHSVSSLNV